MDIEDNAEALRLREALDLVLAKLRRLLLAFAGQIEAWADAPTMAFTHLQPAEPTTSAIAWRSTPRTCWPTSDELQPRAGRASAARDSRARWARRRRTRSCLRLEARPRLIEPRASTLASTSAFESASCPPSASTAFPVATQTYPRKQDYRVLSALAGLARIALQVRVRPARLCSRRPSASGPSRSVAAGRLERHAVQAQPDPRREHGQPGALPGRAAARRLGQRRAQPAGAHARRLGQPPHASCPKPS